jgi:hypothetical protein
MVVIAAVPVTGGQRDPPRGESFEDLKESPHDDAVDHGREAPLPESSVLHRPRLARGLRRVGGTGPPLGQPARGTAQLRVQYRTADDRRERWPEIERVAHGRVIDTESIPLSDRARLSEPAHAPGTHSAIFSRSTMSASKQHSAAIAAGRAA